MHKYYDLFQQSQELNRFLKKFSADDQLVANDSDAYDGGTNEVFVEVQSHRSALFALVAVHYVCNIEYPKNLNLERENFWSTTHHLKMIIPQA